LQGTRGLFGHFTHHLYILEDLCRYVPAILDHYWKTKLSQAGRSNWWSTCIDTIPIPLAGIALGNGWIDARIQDPLSTLHGMVCWIRLPRKIYTQNKSMNYIVRGRSAASDDEANDGEPVISQVQLPDECGVMETLQAAGAGV
jgi:hypothetical protein